LKGCETTPESSKRRCQTKTFQSNLYPVNLELPIISAAILDNPLLLTGAVLICIALGTFLFNGIKAWNTPRVIEVAKLEQGNVSVTTQAVRELVQYICNEVPTIRFRRCHIVPEEENQVSIRVHLAVSPEIRLQSVAHYLEEQIGYALRENLEFSELSRIDIVVDAFLPNPVKPRRILEVTGGEPDEDPRSLSTGTNNEGTR